MKKLNNAGFGLAQVLIIIGLLTAMATFLFERSGIATKSIKASYYRQELYTYNQKLKDYLTNMDICTEAFSGFSIGSDYVELSSSRFGTLFKKNEQVGSNKAFTVTSIKLTDKDTGFIKLEYYLKLKEEFQKSVYFPEEIKNEIHLFAKIDKSRRVINCYYDPYDENYKDDVPNGVISQSIRKICNTGIEIDANIAGASLNSKSMDCHFIGFDTSKKVSCPIGYAIERYAINTVEGNKQELVPICKKNPLYMPGKRCPKNLMMTGVNEDGSLICEPIKADDAPAAGDIINHSSAS